MRKSEIVSLVIVTAAVVGFGVAGTGILQGLSRYQQRETPKSTRPAYDFESSRILNECDKNRDGVLDSRERDYLSMHYDILPRKD